MISENYKNIDALKKFIITKIDKSQEIDKKYNFLNKMRKSAFFLSLLKVLMLNILAIPTIRIEIPVFSRAYT